LKKYYTQHQSAYKWEASADAIVVTCKTEKQLQELQLNLKTDLANWRLTNARFGNDVFADSSRFGLGQLPVVDRTNFTPGLITAAVKNTNDGTYSFNYIVKVYSEPGQRSFDDARGMVINDYQQVLEDKWIEDLKRRYPVKINEVVFRSIR